MITHRLVVADAQTLFTEALAEAMRASGHEVLAACATRRELSAALRSTAVTACLSELRLEWLRDIPHDASANSWSWICLTLEFSCGAAGLEL